MPANLGLAQLSNAFLIAALLCYSLAVLAFGRRSGSAARGQARARVPALVGVGAAEAGLTGDAAADGLPVPDAAPGERPAPSRSGSNPAAAAAMPGAEAGTGTGAGRWVRVALAVTIVGVAAHLLGVITRGFAVHRIP